MYANLVLVAVLVIGATKANAEFTLNFQIKNNDGGFNSGYWTTSAYHSIGVEAWAGTETLTGQTPWVHTDNWHLPEIVYDPTTGLRYYHVLFGSMADGFMQEFFIQTGAANYGTEHRVGSNTPGSASGGEGDFLVGANGVIDNRGNACCGNAADPLNTDPNVDSGNGSGNPRKIIMRQIVADGEITMEFLKDSYVRKPRISQTLNAPDITQMFDIDMRAISYDTTTIQAPMMNQTWLWGQGIPPDAAFFDVTANAEKLNVSAGQYSYTAGAGTEGAEGSYSYMEGEFDHVGVEWSNYIDPSANNPWSYESAKQW